MKKRYIPLWVLGPLLLLIILVAVIISPLGTPVLRTAINQSVSGLHIDDIEGSILSDITVRKLHWENENWQVEAQQVSANLVLGCLISSKVCIDTLQTEGVVVTQLGVAPASPDAEQTTEPFSLPIAIKAPDVSLNHTRINLQGQSVSLDNLETGLSAHESIEIDYLLARGLTVTLPAATQRAPSSAPKSYAISYSAPQLPEITTPIPILVNEFSLTDIRINQGDTGQVIPQIKMVRYVFDDADMRIEALHAEHPQGQATLDAELTLSADYPLDVELTSTINIAGEQTEQVSATVSGSLRKLDANVNAKGPYEAAIRLQADLLTDELPLQLTASWPDQDLPDVPDIALHKGQLTARGKMGAYQVDAQTSADIPQLGTVPVDTRITLNPKNITVNTLTLALLNGKITNSGTLYLNESVSWSGTTNLSNISTTSLHEQGPEDIQGSFTSLMQYNDKGVQVSLTDLDLKAVQSAYPLTVKGSAVYASPSELTVASLQVTQGENQADIAGQIIKNRHLKGTVKLAMQQLEAVYPGLSGAMDADIDISGNWQDPGASGQITFNDVKAGPKISPALAEQGAINGKIKLAGKLSDHQFETNLAVTDYALFLALNGSWENERWVGNIEQSTVSALSTKWDLQNPFKVAVRPQPFSTKVTQSCWQSRTEGQICIEDLLYKQDVARWKLYAEALPAGMWASEFLGELLPQAPDTALSLSSQGKMPKGGRPEGTFSLTMTPATWGLGKEGKVAIDLDKLDVSGSLEQDKLIADAALKSGQLGNIIAHVDTRPFDEDPDILGKIDIEGIQLSPLKPLSSTIRELSGAIAGKVSLTGKLTEPKLNGQFTLSDGNIDVENTPASISNWTQTIEFDGSQGSFDGSYMLGEGKGQLNGTLDWSELASPKVDVALKGQRLDIQQRDVQLKVSPDLQASIEPGLVKITGDIDIPWVRAVIEELPESAVSPSKDVHLRGEPPSEDPLDIVDAKVNVIIDREKAGEVKLEAFGLTANLAGELQVATQPAPVGYGSLQVMNGRYQAYGQDLIIQTGEVQFNGPLDQPLLLVEAIRDPDKTDDGVVAGIRIDGAADNPNISIFTTPTMDQSNALGYLLTGSAPSSGGGGNPNYAAILLGMGLSNTEKIQGRLGSALGIDDFSIGTTSGSSGNDPKLSLNGRINERLSIQYNFDVGLGNSDDTSETVRRRSAPPDLALKYRWLPQFYVEAIQTTIEEQTEFALDFYYQFFLGEAPAKRTDTKQANSEPED